MAASSSSPLRLKYDVFISSIAEDARRRLMRHLCAALEGKKIKFYVNNFKAGYEITEALLKAIEESEVSVVVLCTSSRRCLDELKIHECRKRNGQTIIPVFYKVDPTHVRDQRGTYADAFDRQEQDLLDIMNRVQRWKDARTKSGSLCVGNVEEMESNHIGRITKDVMRILSRKAVTMMISHPDLSMLLRKRRMIYSKSKERIQIPVGTTLVPFGSGASSVEEKPTQKYFSPIFEDTNTTRYYLENLVGMKRHIDKVE
ncbi:TIR-NBS disease resistance-like protein [Quillaja saponaria]|uniref:TIR-NBS disease resistance-like protein n=1 Tax=Quillaja saponaria TaxID=32244 RepID=A0AAD7L4T2_QUISA|nr:TIR-NBS disease resistance-like protein [Quillaja saponaria]